VVERCDKMGWVETGGKIGDWEICPNLSPKEIDFCA